MSELPELPFAVGDVAFIVYNGGSDEEKVVKTEIGSITDFHGQVQVKVKSFSRPFVRLLAQDAGQPIRQSFVAHYRSNSSIYLLALDPTLANYWLAQEYVKKMGDWTQAVFPNGPSRWLGYSAVEMLDKHAQIAEWLSKEAKALGQ